MSDEPEYYTPEYIIEYVARWLGVDPEEVESV